MRAKKVVISSYAKRCQFICRNCNSSPPWPWHALSSGEGCTEPWNALSGGEGCAEPWHALSGGEGCAVGYTILKVTSREVISEGVTVYKVVLGVGYDEVGYEGLYCLSVDDCYYVPSSQP